MNYEHGFHAGNPADVLKHAALTLVLRELTRRQPPIHYFETHAGGGSYALANTDGEWSQGIGKLLSKNVRRKLPEIVPYLDLVAPEGGALKGKTYPGSPWLAQRLLRPEDRLELVELKPEAKRALDQSMHYPQRDPRIHTVEGDGYAALSRAKIAEGSQLFALIDPPFESPQEWDFIHQCMSRAALKRPGATLVLWYPLKKGPTHDGRIEQLCSDLERSKVRGMTVQLSSRGGLLVSKSASPKVRGALLGSGLLFVGAPNRAIAKLAAALPELGRSLSRPEDGLGWDVCWRGWG